MLTDTRLVVRPAESVDLQQLANLTHFEAYVHRHLDYRPALDWVGSQPFLVLEQGRRLAAALASPPDPPEVAWIRLFAVAFGYTPEGAWNRLWPPALEFMRQLGTLHYLAVIPLHTWLETLVKKSGFQRTHSILMLTWERQAIPSLPELPAVQVRPMVHDDLPSVQAIDAAAFKPLWQNSLPYLEYAYHQAALATVIEKDGQVAGYQISTATSQGGHLARLAILPALQGQGLAKALLRDTLLQFTRRGARSLTVNTQHDNQVSLALYRQMGFSLTGEEYPVYEQEI